MATTTLETTPSTAVATHARSRGIQWRRVFNSTLLTLLAAVLLFVFLVPLAYMFFTSLKTMDQMTEAGAPLYPATPETWTDPETGEVFSRLCWRLRIRK